MPKYTEESVQNALKDINSGISQRKASQRWGIPRRTLQDRLNGAIPQKVAHESQQRLAKEQENHLCQWILDQAALGYPPTHQQLKLFATRILEAGGDTEPLGKHWVYGFLRRNPEIKTLRGRSMDSARINGASTEKIKGFFELLKLPVVQAIGPENRYNMDETGILEGRGCNGLVLGNSQKTAVMKKQPGSRSWTTIIECISATGRAIEPLVIFKGMTVQQQWFPQELDFLANWNFSSEKGWTSDLIGLKWLKEVFIPQTKPARKGKRLLIVDGHGSHSTDDFLYECYQNDIHLLFLPPHSSHVLQPLDISVFGPVKSAYRREITLVGYDDSTPIGKAGFLRCYALARTAALTSRNIRAGWLGSGLWPENIAKPLMNPMVMNNPAPPQTPAMVATQNIRETINHSLLPTPQRSSQVRDLIRDAATDSPVDKTMRLLFRKVGRGLDQQNTKLAAAEAQIKHLLLQVDHLRPRKRQKVDEDPNKRFTRIKEVMETRA